MAHNQERKQEIKGQRRHNAHIDSGNRLSVIFQKSLPALRRRLRRSRRIFRDRRLGHLKTKHQKLAMDPGSAPQWVFLAHPLDQITQATINLRPPCPISRFPTPKDFEASAMPPQDGLRLNPLGRNIAARSWSADVRRFFRLINADEIFGTHNRDTQISGGLNTVAAPTNHRALFSHPAFSYGPLACSHTED